CIKEEYKGVLKEKKIITCCNSIRQLIYRAKLFVNYYILQNLNEPAPRFIFKQQVWYTICQLVNNKRPTSSTVVSPNLLQQWDNFKRENPKACHAVALISGASQCLAEACTEVATSYQNAIVETFENRLIYYLRYKIQIMFVSMNRNDVHNIAVKYCYQYICQGNPVWPTSETVNDDTTRQKVVQFCQPLRDILNTKVTMKTLSESPGRFTPLLIHLLSIIESEHDNHYEYDVRRLSLPRRFSLLPTPSLHWRSITLSVNALSAFLPREKLPRGYNDQLRLFFKVLKFQSLRIKT
ncbi:uncharacterized protein BX663DRAFT_433818, partial [Cokeromyces recurvatus]|uniref:uncharacterized protein n=1 Tax=Cokeromyces recurvatus TaxID=90255 RepID=UPI00221F7BC6